MTDNAMSNADIRQRLRDWRRSASGNPRHMVSCDAVATLAREALDMIERLEACIATLDAEYKEYVEGSLNVSLADEARIEELEARITKLKTTIKDD